MAKNNFVAEVTFKKKMWPPREDFFCHSHFQKQEFFFFFFSVLTRQGLLESTSS